METSRTQNSRQNWLIESRVRPFLSAVRYSSLPSVSVSFLLSSSSPPLPQICKQEVALRPATMRRALSLGMGQVPILLFELSPLRRWWRLGCASAAALGSASAAVHAACPPRRPTPRPCRLLRAACSTTSATPSPCRASAPFVLGLIDENHPPHTPGSRKRGAAPDLFDAKHRPSQGPESQSLPGRPPC